MCISTPSTAMSLRGCVRSPLNHVAPRRVASSHARPRSRRAKAQRSHGPANVRSLAAELQELLGRTAESLAFASKMVTHGTPEGACIALLQCIAAGTDALLGREPQGCARCLPGRLHWLEVVAASGGGLVRRERPVDPGAPGRAGEGRACEAEGGAGYGAAVGVGA